MRKGKKKSSNVAWNNFWKKKFFFSTDEKKIKRGAKINTFFCWKKLLQSGLKRRKKLFRATLGYYFFFDFPTAPTSKKRSSGSSVATPALDLYAEMRIQCPSAHIQHNPRNSERNKAKKIDFCSFAVLLFCPGCTHRSSNRKKKKNLKKIHLHTQRRTQTHFAPHHSPNQHFRSVLSLATGFPLALFLFGSASASR